MPRPMVQVIQELSTATVTAASPELNTVMVGPCYNVLTYADDKATIAHPAAYGEDDTASMTAPYSAPGTVVILDADRPGHVTGAVLDDASVNIYFDDCYVEMDNDTGGSGTGTIAAGTPEKLTVVTGFQTDAAGDYLIAVGDRIVVTDSTGLPDNNVRTVWKILSDTELSVTVPFDAVMHTSGLNWYVEHKLDDVLATFTPASDISSLDTITIPNAQATTYRDGSRTVTTAGIYIEYREARQDLISDVTTYTSSTLALAGLGKAVEENPLGLAASLYFSNTTAPLRVLAVATDDSTGHNAAINVLAARTDVYYIGVLSKTSAILASYSTHATQMSQPTVGKFRIAAGGGALVTVKPIGSGVPTTTTADFLDEAAATFITDSVAVSDNIVVAGSTGNDGAYTVVSIDSETRLKVTPVWPSPGSADGTYTITRALDKQAQVDDLELVPVSFNNKRMLLVWPDSITVGGVAVEGYFLTAVLGAMITGLPSHQGLTNIGAAGLDSLSNSNFYFTAAQIDELSDAGWYVFIQESLAGLPFSVHQVTTDQSGLVDAVELNVVKNFDYISLQLQSVLDGFIGAWNINTTTTAVIRQSIENTLTNLKTLSYPRIGARLNGGSVDSISVSESDATMLECYINLALPKPLNTLRLRLVSQ